MNASALAPHEPPHPPNRSVASAATAEYALQELCRSTLSRPRLSTAELKAIIDHLAGLAAALPQAFNQLSEMLAGVTSDPQIAACGLSGTDDPSLAVDTAAVSLHQARDLAVDLCHHLDIARSQAELVATQGPPQ